MPLFAGCETPFASGFTAEMRFPVAQQGPAATCDVWPLVEPASDVWAPPTQGRNTMGQARCVASTVYLTAFSRRFMARPVSHLATHMEDIVPFASGLQASGL